MTCLKCFVFKLYSRFELDGWIEEGTPSGLNGWMEDQTLRPGWKCGLDGLKMNLCLLTSCRIWSQIGILKLIFRLTRRV